MGPERQRPPSKKERRAVRRDERRLSKQQSMSRRAFLAKLIAAGLAVGGGVVGVNLWRERHPTNEPFLTSLENLKAKYKTSAEKLRPIHDRVVRGMERLHRDIQPMLDELPQEIRTVFERPFELLTINERNPNWNHYQPLLDDLNERGEAALHSAKKIRQEDIRYFNYDFMPEDAPPGIVAAFAMDSRSFHLNESLAQGSLIDDLVIYHELLHGCQDAVLRSSIKNRADMEIYFRFFNPSCPLKPGEVTRISSLQELEAYSSEVQVMNMLTKGQFAQDVAARTVNVDRYREQLGATSAKIVSSLSCSADLASFSTRVAA